MDPVYMLKEGYVWNPIRDYPRNKPCWCGSTRRAKACCLPNAATACTEEEAVRFRAFVDAVKTGKITGQQLLHERLVRDQERAEKIKAAQDEAARRGDEV